MYILSKIGKYDVKKKTLILFKVCLLYLVRLYLKIDFYICMLYCLDYKMNILFTRNNIMQSLSTVRSVRRGRPEARLSELLYILSK